MHFIHNKTFRSKLKTKEVDSLYSQNYKMKKQIKDTNKWKRIPCSWISRLTILTKILSKVFLLIYLFIYLSCIQRHPSGRLLFWNWEADPTICKETQGKQESRNSLEKEQTWGLTISNFKTTFKAYKETVIKTVWYWHTDRHTDGYTRAENRDKHSWFWSLDF